MSGTIHVSTSKIVMTEAGHKVQASADQERSAPRLSFSIYPLKLARVVRAVDRTLYRGGSRRRKSSRERFKALFQNGHRLQAADAMAASYQTSRHILTVTIGECVQESRPLTGGSSVSHGLQLQSSRILLGVVQC
ncbi:hypothetical protein MTO96_011948 [Rhipicephalus appendiculatus]